MKLVRVLVVLVVGLTAGCNLGGVRDDQPTLSEVDTDPQGASVFIGGGFVGTTPARFYLPAQDRVNLRLELPGYGPQEHLLVRKKAIPVDAEEGVGWAEVYYYELIPRPR